MLTWVMMLASSYDLFLCLQCTFNAEVYGQVLQQYAIPKLRSSPFQSPTVMHDYASCYTSKKVCPFSVDD